MADVKVPYFKPFLSEQEIEEVIDTLRSGWLTSGPKVKRFEEEFAAAVRGKFAVAVNSCTAALHLAVEALGLKAGQGVLVPTMTFAATAEVVRYLGAIPILVDCDPVTTNMDLEDARRKIKQLREGKLPQSVDPDLPLVGTIPVHVGGLMMDMNDVQSFADENNLWVVEDAAHAFPSAWRKNNQDGWRYCGEATSKVSCFSFYANKTITTGEGGMAVTDDEELACRMKLMSLHGLSHDAWGRYTGGGSWDYRIVAPGFKYNLTDVAAALGIRQLERAEELRKERERIANFFLEMLSGIDEIELPPTDENRLHSWHLFPIKLRFDKLRIGRQEFIDELKTANIGYTVHWRPLHLHPYYEETFGWRAEDCPNASEVWERLVSLPNYPGMTDEQMEYVVSTVARICESNKSKK
jgi:perosamine synthetase